MNEKNITGSELEYVADLLRAISFFRDEIKNVPPEVLDDLRSCLNVAEAAIRRTIAEIGSSTAEH